MSKRKFYCEPCDQTFQAEHDFQTHCKSKKHIASAKVAAEKEASSRSVYVRGFQKCPVNKCQKLLESYFSRFGKVKKAKLRGKTGSQFAIVEFEEFSSVAKCLNVRQHRSDSTTLAVRQSVYHPPRSEQMRLIHQQNEQEEKEKKDETFRFIMSLIISSDNLLDQMIKLSESLKLPPGDLLSRAQICTDLSKLFAPYFENCSVHQFGSSINSFGTAGCDLDLYLNIHNQAITSHSNIKKLPLPFHEDHKAIKVGSPPLTQDQQRDIAIDDLIKQVMKILNSRSHIYGETLIIPSHRCPIVKFLHRPTGIKCDLSLNNRKALYNSLLLRLYGSEPRVHTLVSTVRLWAKFHELAGEVGKGHILTSYALTLLVLFYVMTRQPQIVPKVCDVEKSVSGAYKELVDEWECISLPLNAVLPQSDNTENVVDLLKGFFNFYANKVNWDSDALIMWDNTVSTRASISLDPFYTSCRTGCMTLLDPFVLTHNVLGNINEKVKAIFIKEVKRAAELISQWSDCATIPKEEPWGVAELFLPSPDPKEKMKSPADTGAKGRPAAKQREHVTKVDGEQANGDFIITLQPPRTLGSPMLLEESEFHSEDSSKRWWHLAHAMVIDVLKKVFMTDVVALAAVYQNPAAVTPECSGIQSFANSNMKVDAQEGIMEACGAKQSSDVRLLDEDDEQEELMEVSGGKRTSDDALLDRDDDEVLSPVSDYNEVTENLHKRSSDRKCSLATNKSERKVNENPEKRFCDGLSSLEKKLDHGSSSLPYKDDVTHGTVACSEHNESLDTVLRGQSPQVFSYTCKCKHSLWMGRSKIRKSVGSSTKLSGLDLEVEISNRLLKENEKEKLTMKARQAKQECSAERQSSVDVPAPGNGSKPPELSVEYQCDIYCMSTETLQPYILIKLRPVPDCANRFKNFYCPFRAMISRLDVSNLLDS
ncbi:unnamed protein product [Lymnaea stagnalis]|uniref:Speckle targeted PIP5K1A-regulated poly(A) polymerase n=1 Tax=Lymnaea stagnalis TaxID=6523 RepID=A0AAV2H083_LYMST